MGAFNGVVGAFLWLFNTIITLFFWLVLASVILSWLIAFNVVNTGNPFVRQVSEFLYRVTEPVLGPVRKILPSLGGFDLSPVVVLLGLEFFRRLVNGLFFGAFY